jgi:hypothetical protein
MSKRQAKRAAMLLAGFGTPSFMKRRKKRKGDRFISATHIRPDSKDFLFFLGQRLKVRSRPESAGRAAATSVRMTTAGHAKRTGVGM